MNITSAFRKVEIFALYQFSAGIHIERTIINNISKVRDTKQYECSAGNRQQCYMVQATVSQHQHNAET